MKQHIQSAAMFSVIFGTLMLGSCQKDKQETSVVTYPG